MDETLKYKVQLDTSDLAEQLRQVREQIDSNIGVALGGGQPTAFKAPTGLDFSNPFTTSDPSGQPGGGISSMLNQAELGYGKFREDLNKAKFGYEKFMGDMAKTGLFNPGIPDFQLTPGYQQYNLPTNMPSAFAGMFGFGYDFSNPMTKGKYRAFATKTFAEGVGKFAATSIFSTIGMAGGAWGGPFGGLVGMGVGMAADVAAEYFAKDYIERDVLAKDFSAMASRGGLRRSASDFNAVALETIRAPREWDNRALGYTKEMMQTNIESFAKAGGFSGTRSVEEFTDRVQKVIANTNTIAKQLGVFQEEAARIMGELEDKQVASLGNMSQFASRMRSMGGLAGMAGADLISAGFQGMKNVAGTGLGPAAGFELATRSLVEANMMARGDSASRNAIFDAGGVERATQLRMQTAMQYAQSTPGTIEALNLLGGGVYSPGNAQGTMFGASLAVSQDPANILRALGSTGQILSAGMTTHQMQTAPLDNAVEMIRLFGLANPDGTVGTSVLKGFLAKTGMMSGPEAELAVSSYSKGGSAEYAAYVDSIYGKLQTTLEMEPDVFSKIIHAPGAAWSAAWEPVGDAAGRLYEDVSAPVTDFVENIGDFITGRKRTRFTAIEGDEQAALVKRLSSYAIRLPGFNKPPSYTDYDYESVIPMGLVPSGRKKDGKQRKLDLPKGYDQETFEGDIYINKGLVGSANDTDYNNALSKIANKDIDWNQGFETNKSLYDTASIAVFGKSYDELDSSEAKAAHDSIQLHSSLFPNLIDPTKDAPAVRATKDEIKGKNVLEKYEKTLKDAEEETWAKVSTGKSRQARKKTGMQRLLDEGLDVSEDAYSQVADLVEKKVREGKDEDEILEDLIDLSDSWWDHSDIEGYAPAKLAEMTSSALKELGGIDTGVVSAASGKKLNILDIGKEIAATEITGERLKAGEEYLKSIGFNKLTKNLSTKEKLKAKQVTLSLFDSKYAQTDYVRQKMSDAGRMVIGGVDLNSFEDITEEFLAKDEQARNVTIDQLKRSGTKADRDVGSMLESLQDDPSRQSARYLQRIAEAITTEHGKTGLRVYEK